MDLILFDIGLNVFFYIFIRYFCCKIGNAMHIISFIYVINPFRICCFHSCVNLLWCSNQGGNVLFISSC